MTENAKPRVALIPGDPNGIGPELVAKLLDDPRNRQRAEFHLIGDEHVLKQGQHCSRVDIDFDNTDGLVFHRLKTIDAAALSPAKATRAGGLSVLSCLTYALELARDSQVDAVMFAPMNKAALHLADLGHEDEIRWMESWWGERVDNVGELNVMGRLWSARVTSHIPLKDVAANIDENAICEAAELLDTALKASGLETPQIGVAALNPHAGDGGNFGREEIDIIAPAVQSLVTRGMAIHGPFPSDTVYLKAKNGEFDGVLSMYHDQGQIAMKMMGFDGGVTILAGMPVPIGTPAHGTAFDIVGDGVASMASTENAFNLLVDMALR